MARTRSWCPVCSLKVLRWDWLTLNCQLSLICSKVIQQPATTSRDLPTTAKRTTTPAATTADVTASSTSGTSTAAVTAAVATTTTTTTTTMSHGTSVGTAKPPTTTTTTTTTAAATTTTTTTTNETEKTTSENEVTTGKEDATDEGQLTEKNIGTGLPREQAATSGKAERTALIVVAVIAVGLVICLLSLGFLVMWKRKQLR